jgi:hypothetical protein
MDRVRSRIIDFCDIDARRAVGVYGKLPKSNFCPRPIPPTTFRWYPLENRLLYINFDPSEDLYTWDVCRGIAHDEQTDEWYYHPGGGSEWWLGIDKYGKHIVPPITVGCRFMFAGIPEIILDGTKNESLDH